MPNGALKRDEFEAATKVMESDLLQIEVVVERSASPTNESGESNVAPELPRRGSRVFIVAGIVAAVVLAFDASLFVFHQNRATRPAAAPAAPEPLPRYMLVPLDSPPPAATGSPTAAPAIAPTPATTPVVATAIPATPPIAIREHRHSHHRHASR